MCPSVFPVEVQPDLPGLRRSVSCSCLPANRTEGLRLHGDMRWLADAAVAAGGLRRTLQRRGWNDLRFSPAHLMFRVFHFKFDVSVAEELRHAARHAQARLERLQGPFKDLESPGVWRRGRTDLI